MQELYTPLINKTNVKDKITELRNKKLIAAAVDKTIARLLQGTESATVEEFTGDTLLVRDIIIKYIYGGILRYDIERNDYTIVGLEDPVNCCYPISEGRTVNLAGRADRIDMLADRTLQIIDYKSSNKPHLEFNGMSALFNGPAEDRISNIFQTILYAMMLSRDRKQESCPSLFFASQMLSKEYSPYIVDKSNGCKISKYSEIRESFEEELTTVLTNLFNKEVSFTQVEDVDACTYCDYKKICRR